MEEGQRQSEVDTIDVTEVLILVVMEEGQRLKQIIAGSTRPYECLNPCCNGRGSKTTLILLRTLTQIVLILVVMEEGQRHVAADVDHVNLSRS